MISVQTASHSFAQRRGISAVMALAVYVALSVLFFVKPGSLTDRLLVGGPDPQQTVWFLHWWPFAIAHGLNPFISKYAWFPHGFNLTWVTAVPLAALIIAPVTVLGGAVLSYNLLMLAAPVLSAWTAFLLARYLTRDWWASLVAGYLFGFSSYELGQLLGHLNLDMTFLVPVAILLCVRRARGDMSRPAFIIALALVLLGELGLSTEILATLCVLGAISWVIFFIIAPKMDRRALGLLAVDGAIAGILMAALAAPFLFYLVRGLPDVPPEIASAATYSADPLNFIIPTDVTRLGRTVFTAIAGHFTGDAAEQGAYLGLPLIFLIALYFRDNLARPYARALLIATCVLAVLSMGPLLHINGIPMDMPLPWRLAGWVPVIRSAMPTRFTMYVSLCAAVAAALYLSASGAGVWRPWRYVLAGVACLFLVPNPRLYAWMPWPEQPFFTPQNVRQALGPHPDALILPFVWDGPGMAWQMDAGMRFAQSGGYVGFKPYGEGDWPVFEELSSGVPGPDFRNDLTAFCATHRVDYILVGPGTPAKLGAAISILGWPAHDDHGVQVVKVPSLATASYSYVQGDYWPSEAAPGWMGSKIRIVTHNHPEAVALNGRWRPAWLGPVQMTVSGPSWHTVYTIGQSDTRTIRLPANGTFTLTANSTFVPNQIIHNGDDRKLSIAISLKGASERPQ